jgi:hypothetical protein
MSSEEISPIGTCCDEALGPGSEDIVVVAGNQKYVKNLENMRQKNFTDVAAPCNDFDLRYRSHASLHGGSEFDAVAKEFGT